MIYKIVGEKSIPGKNLNTNKDKQTNIYACNKSDVLIPSTAGKKLKVLLHQPCSQMCADTTGNTHYNSTWKEMQGITTSNQVFTANTAVNTLLQFHGIVP
jgi:hypothetical protein